MAATASTDGSESHPHGPGTHGSGLNGSGLNGSGVAGSEPDGSGRTGRSIPWWRNPGGIRAAINVVYREMLKFGAVGALAYVVDVYVFNLMRTGVWPLHQAPLAHKPLVSQVISVSVATVVAWLGNRYWTFRHRRRAALRREFVLFAVMNAGGLLISLACLWVSHYGLHLTSALADNISSKGVGLALGTLFRFWAYRTIVFTEFSDPGQHGLPAAAEAQPHAGHRTPATRRPGGHHRRPEPTHPGGSPRPVHPLHLDEPVPVEPRD